MNSSHRYDMNFGFVKISEDSFSINTDKWLLFCEKDIDILSDITRKLTS